MDKHLRYIAMTEHTINHFRESKTWNVNGFVGTLDYLRMQWLEKDLTPEERKEYHSILKFINDNEVILRQLGEFVQEQEQCGGEDR